MDEIYHPIIKQISFWYNYEKNAPKTKYGEDRDTHDEYRKQNDLDCILCGGDLSADMIFSLWLPLRWVLVRLNGYEKINKIITTSREKPLNKPLFCQKINSEPELIEVLFPKQSESVVLLSKLFVLGQTRANVMLLKDRQLQKRGSKPYYDYMPYFLYECFEGGAFSWAFSTDDVLKEWLAKEHLECFFSGETDKNNIKDLAETGNIKNGIPKEVNCLLKSYIQILEERMNFYL